VKVRYNARSLLDLADIQDYIATHSVLSAQRVTHAIEYEISKCANFPSTGLKTNRKGLLRWPMKRHSITIYYNFEDGWDHIEIAGIVRSARVKNLRRMPGRR
jgi:plasmid stabilization system protein ParE